MERKLEFFKGVVQFDTELEGEKSKFPIFYYDASSITGIFPARVGKLRKILPKKEYHPLTIFPGIGAIAITAFEYRDTDIRPYNELSISVPISYKSRCCVPAVKLLSYLLRREFHVYIHHLPVTTKIALDGGVIVYNYPKFIAQIDFERDDRNVRVKLIDKGSLILCLEGKKIKADKTVKMRYVTYPVKDRNAQHADVLVNAINFGSSRNSSDLSLELGEEHPISKELQDLLISKRPLQYQYIPKFQSILYGPNRLE